MSLNFYKSKIFIALAVCLGSIGINPSIAYGQGYGTGYFYPGTGATEAYRGIESGGVLGGLPTYFAGLGALEAQLNSLGVTNQNIAGFRTITKFLENNDIQSLGVFNNFLPTTFSALMGAFSSPDRADRIIREHNQIFATVFGANGDYLTYRSLKGDKLTASYDSFNNRLTQVSVEPAGGGRRQAFLANDITNAFRIGTALANSDNEALLRLGVTLWQSPVAKEELASRKVPSEEYVPGYPLWRQGSNGQKGGWVTFPGSPRVKQMLDSLVAAGFGSPIETISATDINRMVANLRSTFVGPFGTADRDLLPPEGDPNSERTYSDDPYVPAGPELLAPDAGMRDGKPIFGGSEGDWKTGKPILDENNNGETISDLK
jgi:hypothetical protein